MPMDIIGGKVQLTSQIQCRCQYGQTQKKSCSTSLKTKVGWSNKENLVDPTMSNLTRQVGYINACWLVKQRKFVRFNKLIWFHKQSMLVTLTKVTGLYYQMTWYIQLSKLVT